MQSPEIAVVIADWGSAEPLQHSLESLAQTAIGLSYRVYLVHSDADETRAAAAKAAFPQIELRVAPYTLDRIGGTNLALREILDQGDAAPEFVLLLAPGARLQATALQTLVDALRGNPQIALAGALLLYGNGSFQSSYAHFPGLSQSLLELSGIGRWLIGPHFPWRPLSESAEQCAADVVEGACALLRTSALRTVGLLDEIFFMFNTDADWCYRARQAGWGVAFVPQAVALNPSGGPRLVRDWEQAEFYRSQVRFFLKHYGSAAALALRGVMLTTQMLKVLRQTVRRSERGTPPLSWGLLRYALRG